MQDGFWWENVIAICSLPQIVAAQRVTLQTLQPSARTKGLVGSHGQIVHHGKDSKSKQKTQGKIQVFEDKTSNTAQKKIMMEDRGVQTDPVVMEGSKSTTSGISFYEMDSKSTIQLLYFFQLRLTLNITVPWPKEEELPLPKH